MTIHHNSTFSALTMALRRLSKKKAKEKKEEKKSRVFLCFCVPLLFLTEKVLRWILVYTGWKRVCVCRQITTDVFAIICVAMALVARVTIHDVSGASIRLSTIKSERYTRRAQTHRTNNNNYTQCSVQQTNEMVNTPHRQSIYGLAIHRFISRVHSIKFNEMLALYFSSYVWADMNWHCHAAENNTTSFVLFSSIVFKTMFYDVWTYDWFVLDPIQHW